MDKLEKYITEHRDQLDTREPDQNLWKKIESDLDNQDRYKWLSGGFLWKAASIVLLLAVIWLVADRIEQDDIARVTPEQSSIINLSEVENYYMDIIQVRQEMIKGYINKYPELDQRFLNDLNKLNENYEQLRTNLENGYSDKLLNAMIVNLQMQIDVLNQQLEIIENIKNIREDEAINI